MTANTKKLLITFVVAGLGAVALQLALSASGFSSSTLKNVIKAKFKG